MNKSFTSLLEYYVVTYVKNEAGQSGETLRSYYTALDQYVLWLADTEKASAAFIDVSHFSREKNRHSSGIWKMTRVSVRRQEICGAQELYPSSNPLLVSVHYIRRPTWMPSPLKSKSLLGRKKVFLL